MANENSGPVKILEKAFVDIYKITSTPIFMSAKHFPTNMGSSKSSLYYFRKIYCYGNIEFRQNSQQEYQSTI